MPVLFFVGFGAFVLVGAALFSLAQAWALADEDIRPERSLLAAMAMAAVQGLAYWVVLFQGRSATAQNSTFLLAAAVSILNSAVVFGISWLRYGRAPGATGPTIWRLFPATLGVFFVLSAIELVVVMFIALSNIH